MDFHGLSVGDLVTFKDPDSVGIVVSVFLAQCTGERSGVIIDMIGPDTSWRAMWSASTVKNNFSSGRLSVIQRCSCEEGHE